MKKLIFVLIVTAAFVVSSCSRKSPEFVHSIPDDAIAVVSLHPMQIHTKSKINTFESIKERVKDEIWGQILEDPLSTGLMMDEYAYVFVKMEDEAPIIGVVGGMKDVKKFENTLSKIDEDLRSQFQVNEIYSWIQPDKGGIIGWNEKQMIVLSSPGDEEFETAYFTESLDKMFSPVREKSITSLVDFKDFQGKMKDLNIWISSNELFDIIEKMIGDKIPDFPVTLYNNYAQIYFDFANGELNINGETHFSEEVKKNIEEFLVMKPELNSHMMNLAPGNNLLVALAGSMDLEKLGKLVSKFAPPELDTVSTKVEMAIGMEIKDLLESISGDFTITINGLESEAMIPVELFIGVGVNGKVLQEKLMKTVGSMIPVEEEGDFFIINFQGNEIYSGIVNDILVVTNVKGYKEAVKGGSYENSLADSRFSEFATGSIGLFVNLDLEDYPGMVKGLLSQNPKRSEWVTRLTDPFDYLGVSAGNYQSKMVLKTSDPSENSLYTILKVVDTPK
ncbi:MAG: DUF4836 family protein [Bacteroidia bacterium]|nr:MAG: DUF4836 family protein [Bacteroidia bacterium]